MFEVWSLNESCEILMYFWILSWADHRSNPLINSDIHKQTLVAYYSSDTVLDAESKNWTRQNSGFHGTKDLVVNSSKTDT